MEVLPRWQPDVDIFGDDDVLLAVVVGALLVAACRLCDSFVFVLLMKNPLPRDKMILAAPCCFAFGRMFAENNDYLY